MAIRHGSIVWQRLTCLERFDDSENALSPVVYENGAEKSVFPHLPFAKFALERLFAHVCPPMDGKCPGNGESLSAARVVARIRLC